MSPFGLDLIVFKGHTQLYTKCGDNVILSQLSADIAVKVILRNSLGEISMIAMTNAIGDRKVTPTDFGLKRGSLHNVLAHRFPGLLLHKTLLCSYIISNFGQTSRGVPLRLNCEIPWKFLQSKHDFGCKGDCDDEGSIVLYVGYRHFAARAIFIVDAITKQTFTYCIGEM